MSGTVPLARTIRALEVLLILAICYHLTQEFFGPATERNIESQILEGVAILIIWVGMVFPEVKLATSTILLTGALAVLVGRPGDIVGPIGVFVTSYSLWHDRAFCQRRRMLSGVLVTLVAGCLVWSTFSQGGDWTYRIALLGLSLVAMLAIVLIFRGDLYDRGPQILPSLALSELALSGRELQILHLFWGGYKPKEIAFELGVAESTIRRHFGSFYRKFGVDGAKELFLLCHTRRICFDSDSEMEIDSRLDDTVVSSS